MKEKDCGLRITFRAIHRVRGGERGLVSSRVDLILSKINGSMRATL